MSTKKIYIAGIIIVAAIAAVFYFNTQSITSATKHTADNKFGGELVYLEQQAHTSLYPPAGGFYPNGGVLAQITDRLTYQNPKTLEIEPWLATSWTINDDDTEFTFTLKPGITFSDGTPVSAEVIAKNFDAFGLGNKDLKQHKSEVINNYDHSEVVDPLTVKFYFKKPSPGFLQGTSVLGSSIVSLKTLELASDQMGDATKIIGSGPFIVAQDIPGKQLDLTVREDYNWAPASKEHQGRAYLDKIQIVVAQEDSVRVGALLSGQANFIRQLEAYDEQRVTDKNYLIYGPSTRGVNNSVAFSPDNPRVSDVRVRHALSLATDRSEIISTLFSDHYPVATSTIAASAQGYVNLSHKLQYDPVKASEILDQAGWKVNSNGVRQKEDLLLDLSIYESINHPRSRETLQLIAQQWAKIGVKLTVKTGDSGSKTVDELDPEKAPLRVSMVGRADPDVIKSSYYPTARNALLQTGGVSTKVKSFRDDTFNTILDGIASEVDKTKRLQLAADAQNYVLDHFYTIPLYEEPQVFAGAPWVKGIAFEAVGRPDFYDTYITQ